MRRFFQAFALCIALLFSGAVLADLVAIPKLERRVTDLTSTLSSAEQSALEQKLAAFEAQKGAQIAVLIVPTTQPEAIEQYSIRVAEAWKVGRKKPDDGTILLIAKDDRKIRLEVGYGLEGAIPDLYAKRIISELITPQFKQGNFYGGIDAGLQKAMDLVSGENLPPPQPEMADNFSEILPFLIFGAIFTGILLRGVFGDFLGSAFNGGLVGGAVYLLGEILLGAILVGFVAFIITWLISGPTSRSVGQGHGGDYGGGWSGGGLGGGGWSGGGGGFGGGGASGDW